MPSLLGPTGHPMLARLKWLARLPESTFFRVRFSLKGGVPLPGDEGRDVRATVKSSTHEPIVKAA